MACVPYWSLVACVQLCGFVLVPCLSDCKVAGALCDVVACVPY